MKITWFGHSAFRLEFGSAVVMIDPFLTGNPAFDGDPEAASDGATHVLLTHGHGDHIGDAVAICKRTGREAGHQLRPGDVPRAAGRGCARPDEHGRDDGPGRVQRVADHRLPFGVGTR